MFDRLHELFNYDQETGLITNKVSGKGKAPKGFEAGYLNANGYRYVCVDGVDHPVHRIVYCMVEGYLPEHQVDHKNGIRDDNRFVNLREVTQGCNNQNIKLPTTNKSGYKGVCLFKRTGKWKASAQLRGKSIHIGYFETKEDAAMARKAWEESCPDWTCNLRKEGAI